MIKEYILEYLQKNYDIEEQDNINDFNFIESGYVDSIGLISFIAEIEEKYDIEFSDEEIMTDSFCTIGGLVEIIESKLENK